MQSYVHRVVPASELSLATMAFLRIGREEPRDLPPLRPGLVSMWVQGLGNVVS